MTRSRESGAGIVGLLPERVAMVVVVPVIEAAVFESVRAGLVVVLVLKCLHVDLASEPRERHGGLPSV